MPMSPLKKEPRVKAIRPTYAKTPAPQVKRGGFICPLQNRKRRDNPHEGDRNRRQQFKQGIQRRP